MYPLLSKIGSFKCWYTSEKENTFKFIGRLQRVQNKCARLVFQRPKWSHATSLLPELHLASSYWENNVYRILVQTFKSLANTLPLYFSSLFQQQRTSYSLRPTSGPFLTHSQIPKTNSLHFCEIVLHLTS